MRFAITNLNFYMSSPVLMLSKRCSVVPSFFDCSNWFHIELERTVYVQYVGEAKAREDEVFMKACIVIMMTCKRNQ